MSSPKVTWKTTPTKDRISRTQNSASNNENASQLNNQLICTENEFHLNEGKSSLIKLWLSTDTINCRSSPISQAKRQKSIPTDVVVISELVACLKDENVFDDFFSVSSENENCIVSGNQIRKKDVILDDYKVEYKLFDENFSSEIDWNEVLTGNNSFNSSANLKRSFYSTHCVASVSIGSNEIFILTRSNKQIILRDIWTDIVIREGDYFNLVSFSLLGDFTSIVIDGKMEIFFVFLPASLLTGTIVADSVSCIRRAVLSFSHSGDPGNARDKRSLIVGLILHEAFEDCLLSRNYSDDYVQQKIIEKVNNYAQQIYFISITTGKNCIEVMNEIMQECKEKSERSFFEFYFNFFSKSSTKTDENPGNTNQLKNEEREGLIQTSSTDNSLYNNYGNETQFTFPSSLSSNKFIDYTENPVKSFEIESVDSIEENIWSYAFGVKGKMDATIRPRIENYSSQMNKTYLKIDSKSDANNSFLKGNLMPFELKTGKKSSSANHLAQTILYSLMLRDRYPDEPVNEGLLFYLGTGELLKVPIEKREVGSLLVARNRLASHINSFIFHQSPLPPKCDNPHTCSYCPLSITCNTYENLGNDSASEFYSYWNQFVANEEASLIKKKESIWNNPVAQRVKSGQCISNLQLVSVEDLANSQGRKLYHFQGDPDAIANSQIYTGDPVLLSTQDIPGILVGWLTDLSLKCGRLLILSDSVLPKKEFDFFIIDRDEILGQFSVSRYNLICLLNDPMKRDFIITTEHKGKGDFESDQRNDSNVKKSVQKGFKEMDGKENCLNIDNNRIFNGCSTNENYSIDSQNASSAVSLDCPLNSDQANVLQRVCKLNTIDNPFLLVHGMPGTGKTTSIANIVQHLVVKERKRVLLAGFTHIAVDMIMLKLSSISKNSPIKMIRLGGSIEKTIPALRHLCPPEDNFNSDIEECASFFQNVQVVGCTVVSGVMHPYVQTCDLFDVCIIDEASQIILPLCLGPILRAKTFVLVGDPYQLPPILVQPKTQSKEFPILTLFDWLSHKYPQSVCSLSIQYRMNEEIMNLPNNLFYNNKLKCADTKVQYQSHNLIPNVCGYFDKCWFCWLNRKKVAFIDTNGLCLEQQTADVIRNEGEANLVFQAVVRMCKEGSGILPTDIGIITPYNAQLKTLNILFHREPELSSKVERYTIDKYQGRDKDTIIISFVRSNDSSSIGDLLQDWRRLNVAITRAKKRIVFVGDFKCLVGSKNEFWINFGELIVKGENLFELQSVKSCLDQN